MSSVLEALTLFDKLVSKIGAENRVPTTKEKAALDRALVLHAKAAAAVKMDPKMAVPQFDTAGMKELIAGDAMSVTESAPEPVSESVAEADVPEAVIGTVPEPVIEDTTEAVATPETDAFTG